MDLGRVDHQSFTQNTVGDREGGEKTKSERKLEIDRWRKRVRDIERILIKGNSNRKRDSVSILLIYYY